MRPGQTRSVTADEIERFRADGVVHLTAILDTAMLIALEPAIDEMLVGSTVADLSEMSDQLAGAESVTAAGRGRFRSGVDHWLVDDRFAHFACDGPLPEIVAGLLGSHTVHLYEDSLLVKEPGTVERTAFHTDLSYFQVDGDLICTTWVPFDPAGPENGAVTYVRGSHRWKREFRPNLFVTDDPIPGTEGELIPDITGRHGGELIEVRSVPGDVVVHHARTVHGASANTSTATRRRALSVRYCGDDTVVKFRRGAPRKAFHDDWTGGGSIDHKLCPLVWSDR